MDFAYYIVRKSDMVILDGASDMVSAINMGQKQGCACLVLQACVITEVGEDTPEPEFDMPQDEIIKPDIIDNEIETE